MKKISIVIINKLDRGIEDTLADLININEKGVSLEIVVVDNSNGKLDDIPIKFPKIKWVAFKKKNTNKKRSTIPEQRNVGVKIAQGSYIVFIDANCIPEKDWFHNLIEPLLNESENIVAGATYSRGKSTLHDQTHTDNKLKKYISECPTINLAFTRKAYDKIGGFDESFEYGSDVDFSWRAVHEGYKIRYAPNAIIRHDWGDTREELKRSFKYGRARALLYIKHRHDNAHRLINNLEFLTYPIYLLFLPLSLFWPWYLLFLLVPIAKNINKQPFKMVLEHFIFAYGVLYESLYRLGRKLS